MCGQSFGSFTHPPSSLCDAPPNDPSRVLLFWPYDTEHKASDLAASSNILHHAVLLTLKFPILQRRFFSPW
jgi:hypothetical protein